MAIQQELMTAQEAAERLGVSDARVRQLCIKYKDVGVKHGFVWLLTNEDLQKIRSLEEFGKRVRNVG